MKNVVLDCDVGQDDAAAIVLALASKELNVVGITAAGGNAKVERCAENTLKILELMNRDIPVYVGEQKPLHREFKTLPKVFGKSGLAGGDDLTVKKLKVSSTKAVDFLVDTFSKPNNLFVCCTAPATNFGMAFMREKLMINDMTVMGGCPFPEPLENEMGNIDDGIAEFNAWSDPKSFDTVINKAKKVNLIGLDVTRSVLYNYRIDDMLRKINTKLSNRLAQILSTIGEDDKRDYGKQRAFPEDPVRAIHDAIAMAYVIDPTMFKSEILPLKIGEKGQTIIEDGGKPINVIRSVDKNKFFDMFISLIWNYRG
ncbi:MAG: nucleoside hydrolase [Rickettsiales bacterium]|jgi:purine nucleosidase|nr:nucleoside hydrolase [Rickettsiales bacterium]